MRSYEWQQAWVWLVATFFFSNLVNTEGGVGVAAGVVTLMTGLVSAVCLQEDIRWAGTKDRPVARAIKFWLTAAGIGLVVKLMIDQIIDMNSYFGEKVTVYVLIFLLAVVVAAIRSAFGITIDLIRWVGIKTKKRDPMEAVDKYLARLAKPWYLFPIKVVVHGIYFSGKLFVTTTGEILGMIWDTIVFPFQSLRNLVKAGLILALAGYVAASLFVIVDYLRTHYGYMDKFLCAYGTQERMKKSVVRVVGGYSEGTGFFISPNRVLTNFHVIDGEPSPKIIFPDGKFVTPEKVTGDRDRDLAILQIKEEHPDLVMLFPDKIELKDEEPLLAIGYPMGTNLVGKATVMKGNFADIRSSREKPVDYVQTNISLVGGMSGGPLTDQCGNLVGVNTRGLAGLSLFIAADKIEDYMPGFSDKDVKKIQVDPSKSPQEAVKAFYTYLKARQMKDGFELLSKEYLQKTNIEEWTNRFTDVLDVTVYMAVEYKEQKDTVFIKFLTKNWVKDEVEYHYYEGTWETVKEDGVYKMKKSKISEVEEPSYLWEYTSYDEEEE